MSNLQFENLQFASKKFVGKFVTTENVRVSVKNDIVRVLSVGVDSVVNSYEIKGGEATFFGKSFIRFLYTDGTTIAGSSYNTDFSSAFSTDLADDSKLVFDVQTESVQTEINSNTATISIVLEVSVFAYTKQSLAVLCGGDVFLNKESLQTTGDVCVQTLPIVLEQQLTTSKTIDTVLVAESSVSATKSTLAGDVLQIEGTGVCKLTYVSQGSVTTEAIGFVFAQEVDGTGLKNNVFATLDVKQTKVRLSIEDDSINNTFTLEVLANVAIESSQQNVVEVATDAYGTTCDFQLERTVATTTLPCGSVVANKTVGATLPWDKNHKLLTFVNAYATVTNCTSQEKLAKVEGYVTATCLYQTDVGTESKLVEIPFLQNVEMDFLLPMCSTSAKIKVGAVEGVANENLEVSAKLALTLQATRDFSHHVVVGATELPFDKSSLPAIEVCVGKKGETIWSLAKSLHMDQKDLLATNPELTNPLEKDTRIVVFNGI